MSPSYDCFPLTSSISKDGFCKQTIESCLRGNDPTDSRTDFTSSTKLTIMFCFPCSVRFDWRKVSFRKANYIVSSEFSNFCFIRFGPVLCRRSGYKEWKAYHLKNCKNLRQCKMKQTKFEDAPLLTSFACCSLRASITSLYFRCKENSSSTPLASSHTKTFLNKA